MNRGPDLDLVLRHYFADDSSTASDHVLDVIEERIVRQPQRHAWRVLWRDPHVNTYVKALAAIAAVIVIAVVGFNLLPVGSNPAVGGPAASPSVSPSAPPSPSASPESRTWPLGALRAQRYHVTNDGVPFSFAPPSLRWRSPAAGEIVAGSGTAMGVREDDYAWIIPGRGPETVATDPCRGTADRSTGSSIDDLAAALAAIPGLSAEQRLETTVDGLPAKVVTLTVDPDPPCDIDSFWLFGQTSLHPNSVDSIIRFWITDVDGQRYTFLTDQASADPQNEREIQQIIDSIQFE
jgi:hypothetical protein